MQIMHHVLFQTSFSKGKFDPNGSATSLKISPLSCHISWLLSYVDELSKTGNWLNFQLLELYFQKVGPKIFSSKISIFGTRPLYPNNSLQGSCPEDVHYRKLKSPFVVKCPLNSQKVISWFLWSLEVIKFENSEKNRFD